MKFDELAESIITISGRMSDEFLRIEKVRRCEISEAATKADLDTACEAAVMSILTAKPPRRKPLKRRQRRDRQMTPWHRAVFVEGLDILSHSTTITTPAGWLYDFIRKEAGL